MSNAMTITLDDLRRAADEIQQKRDPVWRENARAEFWRLVAKWEINSGNTEFSELDEVRAIIAEVEART